MNRTLYPIVDLFHSIYIASMQQGNFGRCSLCTGCVILKGSSSDTNSVTPNTFQSIHNVIICQQDLICSSNNISKGAPYNHPDAGPEWSSGFEEIALLQKVRHECVAQLVDFVWASKAGAVDIARGGCLNLRSSCNIKHLFLYIFCGFNDGN